MNDNNDFSRRRFIASAGLVGLEPLALCLQALGRLLFLAKLRLR